MCNFDLENEHDGPVCGIDEVGRGPLAGPVVAACVYIPDHVRGMDFIKDVRDSKKLSWKKLETLYDLIIGHCTYGICEISPAEIDELNILQASLKAMREAFLNQEEAYRRKPESGFCKLPDSGLRRSDTKWLALIDGNHIPKHMPCPALAIKKGDDRSKSIAAASILAKVTRDRIMHKLHNEFPYYGWDSNVGYPAPKHLATINEHGITDHHRKSFAPVRNFLHYGKVKPEAA